MALSLLHTTVSHAERWLIRECRYRMSLIRVDSSVYVFSSRVLWTRNQTTQKPRDADRFCSRVFTSGWRHDRDAESVDRWGVGSGPRSAPSRFSNFPWKCYILIHFDTRWTKFQYIIRALYTDGHSEVCN